MPDDHEQLAAIRGQLDLILWRLAVIEAQRDEHAKWRRQVWTAVVVAILTAVLGIVLPMLSIQ
jgi:hypothetical protein